MLNRNLFADDANSLPVLLLCAFVLSVLTATAVNFVDHANIPAYVQTSLLHALVYCIAIIWTLRNPGRTKTLFFILAVALFLRFIAMTAEPYLTTDAFRYVWDGRVGLAGINPYSFVPADPELSQLRDTKIYPHINQKEHAFTIYPPFAQFVFMAGTAIQNSLTGMKVMMFLFECLTVAAILGWLHSENLPKSRVIIYAWHPLPIWEFSSQAHIDAAAVGLLALGIWAATQRRQALVGVLFACAALVKYFPLVLLPALWKRWDWRLPTALLATIAVLYLPYVWYGDAEKVLGFLGKHLGNEGYQQGYGFYLVWFLRDFEIADPPGWLYIWVALSVLGLLAAITTFKRPRHEIKPEYLAVLGAVFVLLTSPHYPWYFGFLCVLAVRIPHPALILMTITCVTLQLPRSAELGWSELYAVTYVLPVAIWIGWTVLTRYSFTIRELNRWILTPPPASFYEKTS